MTALSMAVDLELGKLEFRGIVIESASIGRISFEDIFISGLQIRDCTVKEIVFGTKGCASGVKLNGCIIEKVSGIANSTGVPRDIIGEDCEIAHFDNMATNNAVLQLNIPPQMKALLTILRKLYKQAGAGRKISALTRGITQSDVERYIDPVLAVLERHHFITIYNKVVHPVRKQGSRVERILSSPSITTDDIIGEVLVL